LKSSASNLLNPHLLEWKKELGKISARYLTIGTIIAIILNPVFGIVDYFSMQDHWKDFMIIRLSVTLLLIACLLYKPLIKSLSGIGGFLILAIVVTQDAYFFSLAVESNIQQVSLAYMADFVGAGMILLWTPLTAVVFIVYLVGINVMFFLLNSSMLPGAFFADGGLLVIAAALFSMTMVVFRYNSVKAIIISKLELVKNNEWMTVQNEIIEEKSMQLQKSNNRLKEFAYIVSHDLKAPLRGIRNIASWVKNDSEGTLNQAGIDHLQMMDKQIIKMENLIHAILEYSKTTLAQSKSEWINLDELIQDVIGMVEVDNRTNFKIESSLPSILGTRIVVSQVLQNLLSNSIKHNDKTLREVEIKVTDNINSYLFMIADNGPGIPEEDQEKIFDLFITLKSASNYESTGVGLPVARKMVEEAGGNMWLESRPGYGSRFYFSLPKAV
jgi:signal transduction histidine kinase